MINNNNSESKRIILYYLANVKFTNTIDDSIDYTFGSLSFYVCDAINSHPQPAHAMQQQQ